MRGGEQFFVVFSDVTGARFLQFGQRFTRFAPAALTCSAFGLRLKEQNFFFFFFFFWGNKFFFSFFLFSVFVLLWISRSGNVQNWEFLPRLSRRTTAALTPSSQTWRRICCCCCARPWGDAVFRDSFTDLHIFFALHVDQGPPASKCTVIPTLCIGTGITDGFNCRGFGSR